MRLLAARSLLLVIAWVTPVLTFDLSLAGEPRPRSILVLEQSDVRGPFYGAIYSGLESEVNTRATSPVAIYVENLDLRRVVIVGDRFETQPVFHHFKDELPAVAAELEVVDLTGLPMAELRKRIAALPDDAAILYTALFSEGAKLYRRPVDALAMIAEVAERPIVISIETFLGRGGIGGYFTLPAIIGKEAAAQALRILDGESPADIPITMGDSFRPIFDWRQMQRWGVDQSRLPPDSEIRFRDPTAWETYRWQILTITSIILLQTALILGLLYEHRRRRKAEVEGRQRLAELAHMNRQATAGQLSASIAHELNQPLGAILNNAEAAEEVKTIIDDIKRDDQGASEVIKRLRHLFARGVFDP
jgi:hypothetical protein